MTMYEYAVNINQILVKIYSDLEEGIEIFALKSFIKKDASEQYKNDKSLLVSKVHSFCKENFLRNFKGDGKKIVDKHFNVYISKKVDDPNGIIIERKKLTGVNDYIIVGENANSQIILLRSIIIKLFFDHYKSKGCYPLHCAAIKHNDKGYLYFANSGGGKSTIYFTFATYGRNEYSLLSDDTILCNIGQNSVWGYTMPLKPSLRKGTIRYLREMECYQEKFIDAGYRMDDQRYIDIDEYRDVLIELEAKITDAFFVEYGKKFCITQFSNPEEIKNRLVLIICGYKATPINKELVKFVNNMVKEINFYKICVPPNMKEFYEEFVKWEVTNG